MPEKKETGKVWASIGHGLLKLGAFCFNHRDEILSAVDAIVAAKKK